MIAKLGMELLDLRVRELGRRTAGLATPALPCCTCTCSTCGSKDPSA